MGSAFINFLDRYARSPCRAAKEKGSNAADALDAAVDDDDERTGGYFSIVTRDVWDCHRPTVINARRKQSDLQPLQASETLDCRQEERGRSGGLGKSLDKRN
ncbi:MAG: hypothetical protein KGJ03_00870 [Betaproteobacteria bacterium]|nr:hypothetical protein [Betaproteobacteria bacterium]MBU6511756.1 hypothetical protein [Betaproteobacteria bacterium]MDE1954249.1 hypothetical protein [Betaproteobacteria bacterium]MDE2153296.1 hypothetical protein [Betaproteobacteria bacterium]